MIPVRVQLKPIIAIVIAMIVGCSTEQAQSQQPPTHSSYDFDAVAVALELQPGHWIADIGTRDGFYLHHFSSILGEAGHIFAVDIDSQGLDKLHENMRQWGSANISTIYSMETNPMLPAVTLDAIFMRNTYHEFSDPIEMLVHFRKALKPGGRLVISDLMNDSARNTDRRTQEESHMLDIEFVLRDLEATGFTVTRTVQEFAQAERRHSYYWLLIATPVVHGANR